MSGRTSAEAVLITHEQAALENDNVLLDDPTMFLKDGGLIERSVSGVGKPKQTRTYERIIVVCFKNMKRKTNRNWGTTIHGIEFRLIKLKLLLLLTCINTIEQ